MPDAPKRPNNTAHEEASPVLKSDWGTWFANGAVTRDFLVQRDQSADQYRDTLSSGINQGR